MRVFRYPNDEPCRNIKHGLKLGNLTFWKGDIDAISVIKMKYFHRVNQYLYCPVFTILITFLFSETYEYIFFRVSVSNWTPEKTKMFTKCQLKIHKTTIVSGTKWVPDTINKNVIQYLIKYGSSSTITKQVSSASSSKWYHPIPTQNTDTVYSNAWNMNTATALSTVFVTLPTLTLHDRLLVNSFNPRHLPFVVQIVNYENS